MTAAQARSRQPKPLDARHLQPEISSFRLHLAAEGKAATTVRTYAEAVQWFAAAHLIAKAGHATWAEVGKRDVQEWVAGLLGRYSAAYAATSSGHCSSSSSGWPARRRPRTRWPG
jgi:integrase/recombinase XerD